MAIELVGQKRIGEWIKRIKSEREVSKTPYNSGLLDASEFIRGQARSDLRAIKAELKEFNETIDHARETGDWAILSGLSAELKDFISGINSAIIGEQK